MSGAAPMPFFPANTPSRSLVLGMIAPNQPCQRIEEIAVVQNIQEN